ncbi:MAG: dioxygenase [Pseudomonadota bacterium]|nr:dioxygenase [Pseudomonadota bacterium]
MRNLTERNTTDVVLNAWSKNPDPRFKEIMDAMIGHMHDFVREVQLTEAEWGAAIKYLHECADISSPERSEFILTSDVLGVSSLVDTLNNRRPEGVTENSVLGPFYIAEAGKLGEVPVIQNGDDLIGSRNRDGIPSHIYGVVCDKVGRPIKGARLDFWQNGPNGLYDVQEPEKGYNLRCRLITGEDGRYAFTTTRPLPYTIPLDGPVAGIMNAANRSVWRPAHLHVRIEASGYERLTTELFIDGDEYLDNDAVFGVKDSLVLTWDTNESHEEAEKLGIWAPFCDIKQDIVLSAVETAVAAE